MEGEMGGVRLRIASQSLRHGVPVGIFPDGEPVSLVRTFGGSGGRCRERLQGIDSPRPRWLSFLPRLSILIYQVHKHGHDWAMRCNGMRSDVAYCLCNKKGVRNLESCGFGKQQKVMSYTKKETKRRKSTATRKENHIIDKDKRAVIAMG
jgi:hypothetical protein